MISPFTAAQMKQMMQGVVLHGTGKKAILEGYSSAGKTGTGQKVDPATHAYSRTKYVASFAGFAPINDPAITVAVILDSAVGLHQGGQVSAPVFQRVAQQVLEYLHTPHDVELPSNRQVLMAERRVKDQDVEEGSPDRLGDTMEAADSAPRRRVPQPASASAKPTPDVTARVVVPASLRQREPVVTAVPEQKQSVMPEANPEAMPPPAHLPSSGHSCVGRRAGRNRRSILSGQERQVRDRNGAGERTGSGRGRQWPGPATVAASGITRGVGIAGDS